MTEGSERTVNVHHTHQQLAQAKSERAVQAAEGREDVRGPRGDRHVPGGPPLGGIGGGEEHPR